MDEKERLNDIRDDEIRIIGSELEEQKLYSDMLPDFGYASYEQPNKCDSQKKQTSLWRWLIPVLLLLIIVAVFLLFRNTSKQPEVMPVTEQESIYTTPLSHETAIDETPYTEIRDTVVNDIELRLFFPHAATATLSVGAPDKSDTSIILIAQAADVRGDNGEIAGSFVLKGQVLAKGSTKEGFCAIIGDQITVGVNKNSALFEQAIEENGYFFRQYSLVKAGVMEESNPKGKSIRRALCQRGNEVFTVETLSRESFHDFSQALADVGVDNAIYLVGANAYGWAVDKDGNRHEFGDENRSGIDTYHNINYIVWR